MPLPAQRSVFVMAELDHAIGVGTREETWMGSPQWATEETLPPFFLQSTWPSQTGTSTSTHPDSARRSLALHDMQLGWAEEKLRIPLHRSLFQILLTRSEKYGSSAAVSAHVQTTFITEFTKPEADKPFVSCACLLRFNIFSNSFRQFYSL